MNEGNCQKYANSHWVQTANRFLGNNRENSEYNAHLVTVEFLLQNGHCGLSNRTRISSILQHLNQQQIQMTREEFQNQVLTDLKRQGIVATLVYPGRQGGVFIPCNENEVRKVATQVIERVIQELTNLIGITERTQIRDIIIQLRNAVVTGRDRF